MKILAMCLIQLRQDCSSSAKRILPNKAGAPKPPPYAEVSSAAFKTQLRDGLSSRPPLTVHAPPRPVLWGRLPRAVMTASRPQLADAADQVCRIHRRNSRQRFWKT